MIDCVQHINEQGGINGVRVEMPWEDSGCMVPKGMIAHKRLMEKAIVVEMHMLSSIAEATLPSHLKAEVPGVFMPAGPSQIMVTEPIPWIFSIQPSPGYCPEVAALISWIKSGWAEERPPRLGIMIIESTSGLEIVDIAPKVAAEMGIEYIGYEIVPMAGVIDLSVQWLRLVKRNPDWMYVNCVAAPQVVAMKDAERLGVQEKGIKLCAGLPSLDEFVLDIVHDAAEGWYKTSSVPFSSEAELPGVNSVFEAAKKYRDWKPDSISMMYIEGWLATLVAVEGIKLAIDSVGFENVTGRAVRDGLSSIKDFDTGLVPLITMTDDDPWYCRYTKIYQVQQGRIKPISDYIMFPDLTAFE